MCKNTKLAQHLEQINGHLHEINASGLRVKSAHTIRKISNESFLQRILICNVEKHICWIIDITYIRSFCPKGGEICDGKS